MQHKPNSNTNKAPRGATKDDTNQNSGMESSQLMQLFEDELKDIYWAEKALIKALPKMIKKVTSQELSNALESHLKETHTQLHRLDNVFELIEKKVVAKKCEAMAGLLKESESIMNDCEEGAMRDAGIITACQKIEHYEIASYGTLRAFATVLDLTEAASLLALTLDEEKTADDRLTQVAVTAVNIRAAVEELEEVEGE